MITDVLAAPKRIGRPPKEIDEQKVAELAFGGLTDHAIATLIGVDHKTITSRFSRLCAKKRAERKLAIRERQWGLLTGDDKKVATTMAIWLGKNELGQADKAHTDINQRVERIKIIELPPDRGEPNGA